MLTIAIDPRTTITIECAAGHMVECEVHERLEAFLNLDNSLPSIAEIQRALRIADEGSEQGNAAEYFAGNAHEILDTVPDKQKDVTKRNLWIAIEKLRYAFENSNYEV